MTRPSYKEALRWLALNDDCEWLKDDEPALSVAAALVADMFEKEDNKLIADLRRVHAKVWCGRNDRA